MLQEPKYDNSGILPKNNFKKEDKHPDLKGICKVNGTVMEVSAWKKADRNGSKFYSLAFQKPYNPNNNAEPESQVEEDDI